MNTTIKNTGLSFLGGLAGAAIWTQFFFTNPEPTSVFGIENFQKESHTNQFVSDRGSNLRTNPSISFVEASENSTESVVFIKNFSGTDPRRYSMFDYFFGNGPSQRVSTGSGVIISQDGYIVTNNHVIDLAETVEVIHKKRTYKARLVGTDKNTATRCPSGGIRAIVCQYPNLSKRICRTSCYRIIYLNYHPFQTFIEINAILGRVKGGGSSFDITGSVVIDY
jgi:hypothetical protein